ncbi:hypothetical protein VN1239_14770 [Helicobacter pylori]|nr:hypothetical protein VN1239_14770 [Helicobacter pylori]
MSWVDVSAGSGHSGSEAGYSLLRGFINSLGNALNNAGAEGIAGFPWQVGNENEQIVGFYDDPQGYYRVIKKFLAKVNYHSNSRLIDIFKHLIYVQDRINYLNHEIAGKQNAINGLNNEIYHLSNEIHNQAQAINNLNHEIAGLNNEISAQSQAIKQEEEKLNALESQTNAKKQIEKEIKESLKELEKLKKELKRLKKQSKWKKQFNFLTDNPPNLEAQQQHALNQTRQENAAMNFFLTNPYTILPKGFIYEYHNPGKETYNALNAPNNMDGINNKFRVNALNQVLDNSYQKFLPGNDSYNSLGSIEQVKALKFYDLVLSFNLESEKLESALFFKQISQYAKGLRLKILIGKSSKKELERIEQLENTLNQEQGLNANLNTLAQEILKEQENATKLKESIKAKQNYTETIKNAINQKEHAKNPIQQQKQNLENQRNEKEQEKQKQQNDKQNNERERNNLNNRINDIGNERLTLKQLGTPWNPFGIQPFLNNNGWGRTYAKALFSDKSKTIREYSEIEAKIKNILGFYRIGESDERILYRLLELPQYQQNEVALLLLA